MSEQGRVALVSLVIAAAGLWLWWFARRQPVSYVDFRDWRAWLWAALGLAGALVFALGTLSLLIAAAQMGG